MLFYKSMVPDFVYTNMAQVWPPKMGKAPPKSIFEKTKQRILKTLYLKNELVSYMVYLWVARVGAAPGLSEPQALKNVSLQMMIDQALTFLSYI